MTDRLVRKKGSRTGESNARIALWSTDYSDNTGQGIVTHRVAETVLPKCGNVLHFVFPSSSRPIAIVYWFICVIRLLRDVCLSRIDVIYVVCSRSSAGFLRDLPALFFSRIGLRVVVHAHGSDIVDLLTERSISPLAQWVYQRCELIVPSKHLISQLCQVSGFEVHLCENFEPSAGAAQLEIPVSEAAFTLLWNSNVMASKGVFDVMAAVQQVRATGTEIELTVIGSVLGDEEMTATEAETALTAFVHNKDINYFGRVSSEMAAKLVHAADAIALPSRYRSELQPLAVIQAMSAGKAIVASDTPALVATLADYPAEMVPIHSVDAIVSALCRLVKEKLVNQNAFRARHSIHAETARSRFSTLNFDQTIAKIVTPLSKD